MNFSLIFGAAPTSRSMPNPGCSGQSGGIFFRSRRRQREPMAAESRPRASPVQATAGTTSGTPKSTCYRCSPTPHPSGHATHCGHASICSRRRDCEPRPSTKTAPCFPGARSTAKRRAPTMPPAPPPTTSTPTSRMRSHATCQRPATSNTYSPRPAISWSKRPGSGAASASGAANPTAASAFTFTE